MDVVSTIALTMGVAWASGINLYAAIFMLGFMGQGGYIDLPTDLEVLTSPGVMMAAGFMYFIEFFVDKTPGVDTGWDALHSFIRIPAGAILAAKAVGDVAPDFELIALILGGTLAAGTHFTKAGTRVMVNTSPEPFSNWFVSLGEDAMVIAGLWTALQYPIVFIVLVVVFIALMIWLLPKLWRGVKAVFRKIARLFGGSKAAESTATEKETTPPAS